MPLFSIYISAITAMVTRKWRCSRCIFHLQFIMLQVPFYLMKSIYSAFRDYFTPNITNSITGCKRRYWKSWFQCCARTEGNQANM